MSKLLLFSCGTGVFALTVIATLMYGYAAFRHSYAVAVAATALPPELYVHPEPVAGLLARNNID